MRQDTNPTLHSLRHAIQQCALALAHCRWQEEAAQSSSSSSSSSSGGSVHTLSSAAPDNMEVLLSEVSAAMATHRTAMEGYLATWLALAVAYPHLRDGREAVDEFAALPEVSDACARHSAFGGRVLERLRELQSPEEQRQSATELRLEGVLW